MPHADYRNETVVDFKRRLAAAKKRRGDVVTVSVRLAEELLRSYRPLLPRRSAMPDARDEGCPGEPVASGPGWQVQPLQAIEGDVPLPYRITAIHSAQAAVSMACGSTVTISHDGTVRNASGTPIFRLERLDA